MGYTDACLAAINFGRAGRAGAPATAPVPNEEATQEGQLPLSKPMADYILAVQPELYRRQIEQLAYDMA